MKELNIRLKRAYEPPSAKDGLRVLVDRLWPRGLGKTEAAIDRWLKEVAPSSDLRRCLGTMPIRCAKLAGQAAQRYAGRKPMEGSWQQS